MERFGRIQLFLVVLPITKAGVRMEFYEDGDEIVSIWKPRPEYQGWIDTLHGGIQAVLLDEICAWVVLRKLQTTGVTSKMETRYRKSVDTKDSHVVLRAAIKEIKKETLLSLKLSYIIRIMKYVRRQFVPTLLSHRKRRKAKCIFCTVM